MSTPYYKFQGSNDWTSWTPQTPQVIPYHVGNSMRLVSKQVWQQQMSIDGQLWFDIPMSKENKKYIRENYTLQEIWDSIIDPNKQARLMDIMKDGDDNA